ncbi:hypothetical protein D3C81_1687130 [compost metagenome]
MYTRAIGAGLGAENAPASLAPGVLFAHAGGQQLFTFAAHARRQRVQIVWLVEGGDGLHRRVEQADEVGEGIAEKTRHPQRHIHPWAIEQADREDFKIVDALATGGPDRAHAHQGHGLGDVIAAGAHGRRAPNRQAQLAQVIAVVLQVTLQNQISRGKAYAPGGGRRQVAYIHRIEVAPGG